ncbi:nup53/35/40-type RNA recognition motif domain-containing protein [Ditylenchus destructor]|nr:nup53/35/40-type RNA recognition motif domain-containing protein [Ditylenchus destructor]
MFPPSNSANNALPVDNLPYSSRMGSSVNNFGGGESSNNGSGVQYAPNFLFGAQHASRRRSLALSMPRTAVGSPGILKSKETNLSPGNKSVHWSPLLVRERSVSPKRDDVSQRNITPNSLWNGPPLRSIREELGPPEKQMRVDPSQSADSSTSFGSSFAHRYGNTDASAVGPNESDFWVTVFGFPSEQLLAILELFGKHGNIVTHKTPKSGNWVHIRYSSIVHANQALARNGMVIEGIMIGVIPCDDREVTVENGVSYPMERPVSVAFNTSSASTTNDFLLNGSHMVPSVSSNVDANTSIPSRSRLTMSSRTGMRPLNSSFASDSGNRDANDSKNASFIDKIWNYVYNP